MDQLPETRTTGHIASQLLLNETSPAANHAEAPGAESHKDFVHKLKVVLKEHNECHGCLAMIQESHLLEGTSLAKAGEECTALCRITAASTKTVKARLEGGHE